MPTTSMFRRLLLYRIYYVWAWHEWQDAGHQHFTEENTCRPIERVGLSGACFFCCDLLFSSNVNDRAQHSKRTLLKQVLYLRSGLNHGQILIYNSLIRKYKTQHSILTLLQISSINTVMSSVTTSLTAIIAQ